MTGAFAYRIILQRESVSNDAWLGLHSGEVSAKHSGEVTELNTSSLNDSATLLSLSLPCPCPYPYPYGAASGEREE